MADGPSLKLQHAYLDAAKKRDFDAVREMTTPALVNVQPAGRWTALHQAAGAGNRETVSYLLERRADTTLVTREGKTALQVAHESCKELLRASPVAPPIYCPAFAAFAAKCSVEVLAHTFAFLPRTQLVNVASAGSRLGKACAQERFWRELCCKWGAKSDGVAALVAHADQVQCLTLRVAEVSPRPGKLAATAVHKRTIEALCRALTKGLKVLRLFQYPGAGDPIFDTNYEKRLQAASKDLDIFASMAAACSVSGAKCKLERLELEHGFFSAASLIKFLQAAKPPLEAFRCRECLVHARNFRPIVEALRDHSSREGGLLEFETDAYVAGKDPGGLVASALPNLRKVILPHVFGVPPARPLLEKLPKLEADGSELPHNDRQLYGNYSIGSKGVIGWFISSAFHDDGYRGEGLFWGDITDSMECVLEWKVGKGVTEAKLLDFMQDVGIRHDDTLSMDSGSEADMLSEEEEDGDEDEEGGEDGKDKEDKGSEEEEEDD